MRDAGADVRVEMLDAGHEIAEDAPLIADWLATSG